MLSSTAILATSNIEETIAYYKNVLGFESGWTWGDPPTFGSASMGGVTLMFNLNPEVAKHIAGHQHWINVDDADDLYESHKLNGARFVSGVEDKPWGRREYVVEDLNGYYLRFAGPPSRSAPKSQPFPDEVRIERRKPTNEEFLRVAGAAFDYREPLPGLLEGSWGGVVALSPEENAVGVLRIMRDSPGWFSIWDVAVLPSWQARRIGSAMMRAALEMIHEARSEAIVYLFTYKHGFYERLGFTKETVSMKRF